VLEGHLIDITWNEWSSWPWILKYWAKWW